MPAFPALPPPRPGFELLVSQPGMSQGLAQTEGTQLFPRALVRVGDARVGTQWRNVDSPVASGVAAIFTDVTHTLGQTQLEAAARYRIKTGARHLPHSEAWEFSLGARRSFGRLSVRLSSDYSPDEFGSGRSLWVEAGPSFAIDKVTEVSASIGRRERASASDYMAFNAGVRRRIAQQLSVDIRYYGTNRAELDWRYARRIVLSARLAV